MKLHIEELEKALKHIRTHSTDLYPTVRIETNRMEISFVNKEGEASAILIYDDSTNLPAKITTFSRLK